MARSYENVKNFIEVESNSGCKLKSKEYVRDRDNLEIECKCGTPFTVTFDRFRSSNQRQCKECGYKKKQYKWNHYTIDDFINIVKNRAIDLDKVPQQKDFGNKNNLPSATTIITKLGCTKWNDVLQLCEVGSAKEKNYDEEKALNKLKEYIDSLGYVPTRRELQKANFKPSMSWFGDKFGSFEKALQRAGYTSITTDEDLLNIIRDFSINNGKSPTTKDMCNANGFPSTESYYGRFNTKSWNEILQLAGLEVNHYIGYTKEYALEKLKEYYSTYNKILTRDEFREYGLSPSHDYYCKHFDSYENACYLAGIAEIPLTDDERIKISINELIKVADKLNRCPTVAEYENIEHRGFGRRVLEEKLYIKYNDICRKYLPKYELNNDLDIPKEKILNDIRDMLIENGGSMTFEEMKEKGLPYSYNIFDSKCHMLFNEIILHLGYTPIGTTTIIRSKDEMLEDFNNLFLKLKRIPYVRELDNIVNTASCSTYIKHFGSIENICALLNIDYAKYYRGTGAGTICFDKNGGKCRSFVECVITNFYIDNNIEYEKETSYSEFITGDKRRFDWKLPLNGENYYVEYAGMYYPEKINSHINIRYVNKIDNKIKDLKDIGVYDQCLFIYPEDIKTKTLKEIFEPFLGIELKNGNTYKINSVEYFTMTSQELLDNIMIHSVDQNILPSTSVIVKKESGIYKEILKRFKTYNNFALHFGMKTMCTPRQK